jgi:hypothetical protein
MISPRNGTIGRRFVAGIALATLTAGCERAQPAMPRDEAIARVTFEEALSNGVWARIQYVLSWGAFDEALPAREIFPSGYTGTYGQPASRQAGNLGEWGASGPYAHLREARRVADELLLQLESGGSSLLDMVTEAHIAAGYTNRILGDYFCWGQAEAPYDPGPLFPGNRYWQLAADHFTKALASASSSAQRVAAYAGRAQARLALGDYDGAIADARQVHNDFQYYPAVGSAARSRAAHRNHVYWANADRPYRSWTVTYTFFHSYYAQTGDPRVAWASFPDPASAACSGSLSGKAGGVVECTQQRKYVTEMDEIAIASGAEMRLNEAEALLRRNPGNWQQAMTLINSYRTRYVSDKTQAPLAPWMANNLDDAWTFLMRERGIELWLEGRRFSDMRRWEPYIRRYGTYGADGQTLLELPPTTPGALDWPDFEGQMTDPKSNIFTVNMLGRPAIISQSRPRELCYNVPQSVERTLP